jgi:hypothetical protein
MKVKNKEDWSINSHKAQVNPKEAHGFLPKTIGFIWIKAFGEPNSKRDAQAGASGWCSIPATWEAEMGKITVQDRLWQNKFERPSYQPIAGHNSTCQSSQATIGGWDQEGQGFRPAQAKMFPRLHLNWKKLGMVQHSHHPSYSGKCSLDCGPDWPGKKQDLISKITRTKRAGGRHGSSTSMLASQVKTLSSHPSTTEIEGEREREREVLTSTHSRYFDRLTGDGELLDVAWTL